MTGIETHGTKTLGKRRGTKRTAHNCLTNRKRHDGKTGRVNKNAERVARRKTGAREKRAVNEQTISEEAGRTTPVEQRIISTKQTSRNSQTNLNQTIESNRTKPTNHRTVAHKTTAEKNSTITVEPLNKKI